MVKKLLPLIVLCFACNAVEASIPHIPVPKVATAPATQPDYGKISPVYHQEYLQYKLRYAITSEIDWDTNKAYRDAEDNWFKERAQRMAEDKLEAAKTGRRHQDITNERYAFEKSNNIGVHPEPKVLTEIIPEYHAEYLVYLKNRQTAIAKLPPQISEAKFIEQIKATNTKMAEEQLKKLKDQQ